MTLSAGTRLGPYEILAPLGAGGMGEVWRAKDTRLDREVAVKVLPKIFADDEKLRARFEREAKSISSLNHPHICTLFDVGHQEGTQFLVMELLDGESLADRIVKGPLPIDQVLRYGAQVAEALHHAHKAGIVHRDLKPGNVMLTKAGAKLLDFGLARTSPDASPVQGLTTLPTQAKPLTTEGMILGTFQYMAPEQLEGEEADARTDIFALGAVLYEMATGRKAFTGKSRTSLIASIVSSQPPPISTVLPVAPPALDHVVRRCLEKEREDRWQSAHDVAGQLKWIGEAGSQAGIGTALGSRRGKRLFPALLAAMALVCLASVPLAVAYLWHGGEPVRPLRFNILPPEGTTVSAGLAVSPDGRYLVVAASDVETTRALWLRSLESGSSFRLAGSEDALYPFWSPDSRQIGFFTRDKIKRTDPFGGLPQVVCDLGLGGAPRGGTWSKDGVILFTGSPYQPLSRVSADGGTPVQVTKLADAPGSWISHRWPQFLPDGHHFLYLALSAEQANSGIYMGSLDGGSSVKVVQAQATSQPAYSSGLLLFARQGSLLAQPFDPRKGLLSAEPVRVSDRIGLDLSSSYAPFSVSSRDILVFDVARTPGLELTWFDRAGKELTPIGSQKPYRDASLSPDGARVAANLVDAATGLGDLWILDLGREVASRFTFHPSFILNPIWSPDGSRIVYASRTRRGDLSQLFEKRSDGTAPEQQLMNTDGSDAPSDWSCDGRYLVYEELDRTTNQRDLWILPMFGDRKPAPYMKTPFDEFQGQFSPDGKWMAYGSNESGRWEVYVQPVPASGGKWQISSTGGTQPRWRQDGKELFYLAMDGKIMSVEAKLGAAPQFAIPKALFQTRIVQNALGTDEFVPSADGQRFLATNGVIAAQGQGALNVVVNWSEAIQR